MTWFNDLCRYTFISSFSFSSCSSSCILPHKACQEFEVLATPLPHLSAGLSHLGGVTCSRYAQKSLKELRQTAAVALLDPPVLPVPPSLQSAAALLRNTERGR